jgi:hypothetical protein
MESTVQTNRFVSNNETDIITHDNIQGTCMSIDVSIPAGRNVIKKGKKILKYKDLKIEIQFMWNVKAKVIPIITGGT